MEFFPIKQIFSIDEFNCVKLFVYWNSITSNSTIECTWKLTSLYRFGMDKSFLVRTPSFVFYMNFIEPWMFIVIKSQLQDQQNALNIMILLPAHSLIMAFWASFLLQIKFCVRNNLSWSKWIENCTLSKFQTSQRINKQNYGKVFKAFRVHWKVWTQIGPR